MMTGKKPTQCAAPIEWAQEHRLKKIINMTYKTFKYGCFEMLCFLEMFFSFNLYLLLMQYSMYKCMTLVNKTNFT